MFFINFVRVVFEMARERRHNWLLAVNKWNEAVDKLHKLNVEIYNTRAV